MEAEQKRKEKKRVFGTQPKKTARPRPDGPNASGWYERLCVLILMLLVFKSVQLQQQSNLVDKNDSFSG